METLRKQNRIALGLGAVALAGLIGIGAFIFRKMTEINLTPWLLDYLEEIEEKFRDNNNEFSPEILGNLIHLNNEIKDYLVSINHPELARERRERINQDNYDSYALKSFEASLELDPTAFEFIESKFGINYATFTNLVRRIPDNERDNLIAFIRDYPEENLPQVEIATLKEAYSTYVKAYIKQSQEAEKNLSMSKVQSEYREVATRKIYTNKYKLNDYIYKTFGIETKYLNQLIKKHDLLSDPTMKGLYNELSNVTAIY